MARLAPVPDLEEELDRLYGLSLSEFTAARNDLARRLRAAGQREAAERAGKLAKPSISAWAVNQLARHKPGDVEALARLGGELAESQLQAASGRDGKRFEELRVEHGRAVAELAAAAADLLAESGSRPGDAVRRRIAETLRALSLDADRHDELVRGRLAADAEPTGFALAERLGVPAASAGRRAGPAESRRDRGAELRARLGKARAEARAARARASEADQEARRSEREAERARERATRAATEAEQAAEEVQALERDLHGLRAKRR